MLKIKQLLCTAGGGSSDVYPRCQIPLLRHWV